MIRKILSLGIVVLLAAMAATSAGAETVDLPGVGSCSVVKTAHFKIVTNLNAEEQTKIAEGAERARSTFIDLISSAKKWNDPPEPFVIYFFNTRQELAEYCKQNKITLYSPMGFYHPAKKACYFTRSPYGLLSIVYHEVVHQMEYHMLGHNIEFLTKRRKNCTWVEEGVANYVETVLMGDDAKFQNKKSPCLQKIAQFPTLKQFCSFSHEQVGKLDPAVSCGMYVVIFHYFIHGNGGKFKEKVVKHALIEGKASAADLEAALGVSLESLQADFAAYAKSLLTPKTPGK